MWLMEQRLLLEINKPINAGLGGGETEKNNCCWKARTKLCSDPMHRDGCWTLKSGVHVDRANHTAPSLSPFRGQSSDGWSIDSWHTGPRGLEAEGDFHIFHVNSKDNRFSSTKAGWLECSPYWTCVFFNSICNTVRALIYPGFRSQMACSLSILRFLICVPWAQRELQRALSGSIVPVPTPHWHGPCRCVLWLAHLIYLGTV